jgi:hypothetical protein
MMFGHGTGSELRRPLGYSMVGGSRKARRRSRRSEACFSCDLHESLRDKASEQLGWNMPVGHTLE